MKTKKISVFLFMLLFIYRAAGQEASPAGVTADWNQQAIQAVQETAYRFYPGENAASYRATNTHNHLQTITTADGYLLSNIPVEKDKKKWQAGFYPAGIGRNDQLNSFPVSFIPEGNKLSLIYRSSLLDIAYTNDRQGLKQNFIIKQKPAGEGTLAIKIRVETILEMHSAGENKIIFNETGNPEDIKLIVDGLKVWDAQNRILSATLEPDNTGNMVITVDDAAAEYPLTIDPLNRVPEWTTSADGILPGLLNNLQLQVQTLYGYTVAGLGDINGDGYDDVAVSAPGMADVITGTGTLTGVGAVFIYLGSPLGLSTTPSKVLQPSTALNGALFGFSVDAGDITGDGRNDIIIGAPMDSYQTTASGLLGSVNVNVTAGKVYIYRSEDLLNSSNPAPFLELKLQGSGFFSTGILNILQSNVNTKPLFGYAVAVTKDLNGDNKADILIGTPAYLGVDLLSAQSGAAFIYYSNNLATASPAQLKTPDPSLLGLINLPVANTSGLLFGFSIDGAGDYNGDGYPDIVVGAPAGADLSSLGGIFTGQFLGGSAYVYFGSSTGINTTSTTRLQAASSGLLSNTANLFGYKVKGAANAFNGRTGTILIGSPDGAVLSNVLNGLRVKAGQVHVFKKRTGASSGNFTSDQVLSSPRSSSVLSILAGQTINVSLLYGSSIDNMLDINCDNIGDIIVGEPLSTAVPLIGADVVGGAAYIYLGKSDGTYNSVPFWDLYAQASPLLGVNTTALLGFSVAGARRVQGGGQSVRALVGGPSNALDYGTGLLNLGNTLGTTFDFVFDNNGLGKSYLFSFTTCNATLPVTLTNFSGQRSGKTSLLNWTTVNEDNLDIYELERSTDGIRFDPVTIAFPLYAQRNDYKYTDQHPVKGMNYYRLKMIDKDKQFRYSAIVAVRFDESLPAYITIAPNPAKQDINVRMNGLENGMYRLELVNAAGQFITGKSVMISQPLQQERINANKINPGVYWLSVYAYNGDKITTVKVVFMN